MNPNVKLDKRDSKNERGFIFLIRNCTVVKPIHLIVIL